MVVELVGLFIGAGISGAKDEKERPGLREALAAITGGQADALAASKRDRLARDMSLAGFIETMIRRAGGELFVLDEQDVRPLPARASRQRTAPTCHVASLPPRSCCGDSLV